MNRFLFVAAVVAVTGLGVQSQEKKSEPIQLKELVKWQQDRQKAVQKVRLGGNQLQIKELEEKQVKDFEAMIGRTVVGEARLNALVITDHPQDKNRKVMVLALNDFSYPAAFTSNITDPILKQMKRGDTISIKGTFSAPPSGKQGVPIRPFHVYDCEVKVVPALKK